MNVKKKGGREQGAGRRWCPRDDNHLRPAPRALPPTELHLRAAIRLVLLPRPLHLDLEEMRDRLALALERVAARHPRHPAVVRRAGEDDLRALPAAPLP